MNDAFDFIADIHGQHDKLVNLLEHLGYASHGAHAYRHPQRRRVIFLGDYIDRGPKIRQTLQTVREMVDAGDAMAIMGNHEFNAIAWATRSPKGGYLRHHGSKNRGHHAATLAQFEGHEDEWQDWLAWFKQLPMWLDLGDVRAVHACWDASAMTALAGGHLSDPEFLLACAIKGSKAFDAVETLLKGPELDLPSGVSFTDKQGIERTRMRSRWWRLDEIKTLTDLAMPPGSLQCDVVPPSGALGGLPQYTESIPVFFGHYWLPANFPQYPLTEALGCLDFSAGLDGPLVAYRWDGEQRLIPERMIRVS